MLSGIALPQIAAVIGFRIDIEKRRGESDAVSVKVLQRVGERIAERTIGHSRTGRGASVCGGGPRANSRHPPRARKQHRRGEGCGTLSRSSRCYEWNVGADDDKRTLAAAVENALHALSEAASALRDALAFPGGNRHPRKRILAYPGSLGIMSHVSTFCDPGYGPSGRSGMTKG